VVPTARRSGAYNIPNAFRLAGALDTAGLERSLNEVIARHESLRTSFASEAGVPMQIVAPALVLPLPAEDLSALPAAAREAEMLRIVLEAAAAPFELNQGPLVRARLLRLDAQEHVFFVNVHHSVADGLSTGVLFAEISVIYRAFATGRPSPLPEPAIQFADYAAWQQHFLEGDELTEQLDYWRKQLGGELPIVELPSDRATCKPDRPWTLPKDRGPEGCGRCLAGLCRRKRRQLPACSRPRLS
jgi:hypothetical protein